MINLKWTDEEHNHLVDLVKRHGTKWTLIAKKMSEKFAEEFSRDQCRSRWRMNRHKAVEVDPKEKYGRKLKRNSDGTVEIDQLISIPKDKLKDERAVLEAKGLDPNVWAIINHDISLWEQNSNEHGLTELHASKVKVKPKEFKLSESELLEAVMNDTKPINLKSIKYKLVKKQLLEVPLFDLHFGANTLEYYLPTLSKTVEILESRVWEEVLITFGSDLMHVDSLNNTTTNQTRIQDVDHVKMIEDVKSFYEKLVTVASKQSNHVKVINILGNHDSTVSSLLIHWLEGRFREVTNVEVDCSIKQVKVNTFGKVFIAHTHGEKGGKRVQNTLSTQYPVEWARSKTRSLHTGHLHHESCKDENGIITRVLPTRAETDKYHEDNSFVGAHKRFQIFEYDEEELLKIHYV